MLRQRIDSLEYVGTQDNNPYGQESAAHAYDGHGDTKGHVVHEDLLSAWGPNRRWSDDIPGPFMA